MDTALLAKSGIRGVMLRRVAINTEANLRSEGSTRKPPSTVAAHQAMFGRSSVASFRREPARKTTHITSKERHAVARALRLKAQRLRESVRRHSLMEAL